MLILRTTAPSPILIYMTKEWHPDELARHWLLSPHEHDLLGESGAARLNPGSSALLGSVPQLA